MRVADEEPTSKILYPPLELFHRYQRQEAQQFNAALVDALTWHEEYWTTNEARCLSSDGLVALGPLAIACMAHDADMPIEVEFEYLPMALLKRIWVGEFPLSPGRSRTTHHPNYSQPFSRAMRTASARLRAASFWMAMER
ncbi:immunity 49 family protein [Streptomyces sp. NPDC001732]